MQNPNFFFPTQQTLLELGYGLVDIHPDFDKKTSGPHIELARFNQQTPSLEERLDASGNIAFDLRYYLEDRLYGFKTDEPPALDETIHDDLIWRIKVHSDAPEGLSEYCGEVSTFERGKRIGIYLPHYSAGFYPDVGIPAEQQMWNLLEDYSQIFKVAARNHRQSLVTT